jgi:hypothetical protein
MKIKGKGRIGLLCGKKQSKNEQRKRADARNRN